MNPLPLTIPAQDCPRTAKIRPRQLRDWLDDLPYLDGARAARLASHQLRTLNRQPIAPAARLEVLGDFLAAYHRLSESLPTAGASAETTTRQLLKRLCQDIGFGYKIAAHELANTRTRFLDGRNLSLALLGVVHTLGTQLTQCYAHHQRAPRALWNECLAVYRFARDTGRDRYGCQLRGVGEAQLDASFRLLSLLRLANPYRLAPGMVAALQRYLHMHIGRTTLETAATANGEGIHIALMDPDRPGESDDPAQTLVLDITALIARLSADIRTLERHGQAHSIGLPPEIPAATLLYTLQQLRSDWESPRSRNQQRGTAQVPVELVLGLDAAYCVLNRGRCFDRGMFLSAGHEEVIDLGAPPVAEGGSEPVAAAAVPCLTVNRSSSGVALSHRGQARPRPRVGQLVALRRPGSGPAGAWIVAVCRWLVEPETGAGFDIGLQYMAREARPVVIRPLNGDYQPALLADQRRGEEPVRTLVAHSGRVTLGASVAVYERGRQYRLRCGESLESGPGFERFICQPE